MRVDVDENEKLHISLINIKHWSNISLLSVLFNFIKRKNNTID